MAQINDSKACCSGNHETPDTAKLSSQASQWGSTYRIPSMDCAAEESQIRNALAEIKGITGLKFSLSTRTLTINCDETSLASAIAAIQKIGFKVEPLNASEKSTQSNREEHGIDNKFIRPVIGLLLAIGAECIEYFMLESSLALKLISVMLSASAILMAGFTVYKKGISALVDARLNINALMSVAVTGAFLIGQWPEAAMVMTLYAIAEIIEAKSVDRARNAIQSLLALAPDDADVRQVDGSWLRLPASEIQLGAIVRVRPGERLALDGIVIAGISAVNQAPVTGESIPVDKKADDHVFAGTINESGTLEFKVTASANNTTLSRIIHAVEEAQATQAPTQRFVDQFATIYTPTIFALALAVAYSTPFLFGWTWLQAIYKALVLLVIACPCALVISTPVTVVSGLAAAARRGILIKGGVYLEGAKKLKMIALDKTGTITEGKPSLVACNAWQNHDWQKAQEIASAIAHASDHPVSKAIATGLSTTSLRAENLQALAGRGVEAVVDGKRYVLGNHRLIEDRKQCSSALETILEEHERQGRTVTLLAGEEGVMGIFAVADIIKHTSQEAVVELNKLGIVSIMLTGDNQVTAEAIAKQANIKEARGNLLPNDKLQAIKTLQKDHGLVAMIGDGINDAPALAQADIGIAMGAAGTDTAMEAADIVVMNDDLRRIPEVVRLSQKTHFVLWQNIAIALGIKAVFFFWALFGNATMWMAVFADMGASLIVVVNGLRLLR